MAKGTKFYYEVCGDYAGPRELKAISDSHAVETARRNPKCEVVYKENAEGELIVLWGNRD